MITPGTIVVDATSTLTPGITTWLLTDKNGNVYVTGKSNNATATFFMKYDTHLVKQWQFSLYESAAPRLTLSQVSTGLLSVSSDGSVFFGGTTSAPPGSVGTGAMVGKVNSNGSLAWANPAPAGTGLTTLSAATSDGGVVFMGTASGQVAGNPPGVSGGPWLARYGSDGTMLWIKQYASTSNNKLRDVGSSLFIDSSNNIYCVGADALKISPTGDEIYAVFHDDKPGSHVGGKSFNPTSMTTAADAFYTWTSSNEIFVNGLGTGVAKFVLSKYDTNFKRLLDMQSEATRKKVLDPLEGVTWIGSFNGSQNSLHVDATLSGTVFLAGDYSNTYMNGATPRPPTSAFYVGRYGNDGTRIWFKELVTSVDPNGKQYATICGFAYDDATKSIVMRGSSENGAFLFKLNAADGSVIQTP